MDVFLPYISFYYVYLQIHPFHHHPYKSSLIYYVCSGIFLNSVAYLVLSPIMGSLLHYSLKTTLHPGDMDYFAETYYSFTPPGYCSTLYFYSTNSII